MSITTTPNIGADPQQDLSAVAARWPQLSALQVRRLYDLVYGRSSGRLHPPAPCATRTRQPQWSPLSSGFPLMWAVRAEQQYARRLRAVAGEETAQQAA
jgi:hypothetical protein